MWGVGHPSLNFAGVKTAATPTVATPLDTFAKSLKEFMIDDHCFIVIQFFCRFPLLCILSLLISYSNGCFACVPVPFIFMFAFCLSTLLVKIFCTRAIRFDGLCLPVAYHTLLLSVYIQGGPKKRTVF